MQNRWLVLSIQYLKTACGKGEEDKLVGFRNPSELNIEDFYDAFVMRSNPCKSFHCHYDNEVMNTDFGCRQQEPRRRSRTGAVDAWRYDQLEVSAVETAQSGYAATV